MGARNSLAEEMGWDDKQRLKRLQLQVSCHKAVVVEGDVVYNIVPLLIRPVLKQQRELVSIRGPFPSVRVREGSSIRRQPRAPKHTRG